MAENIGIPFPAKLELSRGNIAQNWKKFHRVWENYEIATGLNEKDPKLRIATLLTCLGPDAIELFETFPLSDEEKKDPAKVVGSFQTYCIGETNETYERYNFNCRSQEMGENIDAYVASLRGLVKTCNYEHLEDSLIRDRIVIGIRDNNSRKKLLQEKKLNLSKCIDICRANEMTNAQMKTINHDEVHVDLVNAKSRDKKLKDKSRFQKECWYCGQKHAFVKEECPAWGKKCSKCGGNNHFAIKCTGKKIYKDKRKQRRVHIVNDNNASSESETEDDYVLSVETVNGIDYPKKLFTKVSIGEK